MSRCDCAECRARAAANAGPDVMLRHLIYAAIVHEGRIKTMADEEKAANRVFDMLVRGNHLASAAPARAEGVQP